MADTLTGGGIFLRRGNKQETVGSTAARGLSLENEPMYGNGSKLVRFKPPMEQQRQFGEIVRRGEIPKAVTLHNCI